MVRVAVAARRVAGHQGGQRPHRPLVVVVIGVLAGVLIVARVPVLVVGQGQVEGLTHVAAEAVVREVAVRVHLQQRTDIMNE